MHACLAEDCMPPRTLAGLPIHPGCDRRTFSFQRTEAETFGNEAFAKGKRADTKIAKEAPKKKSCRQGFNVLIYPFMLMIVICG